MIKVKVGYRLENGDTKKTVYCPKCGHKYVFYYVSPIHCTKCDKKLPDLIDMIELKILGPAKRLQYHMTGETLKRTNIYDNDQRSDKSQGTGQN